MGNWGNANEPVIADDSQSDDDVEGFGLSLSPNGPLIKPVVDGLTMPSVRPTSAQITHGYTGNANEPVLSDGDESDESDDVEGFGLSCRPMAHRSTRVTTRSKGSRSVPSLQARPSDPCSTGSPCPRSHLRVIVRATSSASPAA